MTHGSPALAGHHPIVWQTRVMHPGLLNRSRWLLVQKKDHGMENCDGDMGLRA